MDCFDCFDLLYPEMLDSPLIFLYWTTTFRNVQWFIAENIRLDDD